MRTAPSRPQFPGAVHLSMAATLVALWASGLVVPAASLALAAALAWAVWRDRRGERPGVLAERAGTVASFLYLIVFAVDLFVLSHNLLYASLRLLIFLSILRLLAARSDRERVQLLLLGFLGVVAATASTTEMTFALPLSLYTATVLRALACRQADRAGTRLRPTVPRILRWSGAVLLLGLLAFFLIPHVGTGYFRAGGRLRQEVSGFSGRIELGAINRIKKNHEIVMRITLHNDPPAGVPLRWRGRTFDTFDGRAWTRSREQVQWLFAPQGGFDLGTADGAANLEYDVLLEPIESRALFAAADMVRMQTGGFRRLGAEGGDGYQLSFLPRSRIHYQVTSRLQAAQRLRREPAGAGQAYPPEVRDTYLQLPPLAPGIPALAREMAGGETDPYRMAERIESALQTGYTYTLDVQDVGVSDPLRRFLLEHSPGHCEYFSTSMAILLRTLGVPARVVTGFLEGEYSDLHGTILVRQSDAHSWVEVFFPGHGWVGFDPTPSVPVDPGLPLFARIRRAYAQLEVAWDTWVIGLDLNDQVAILGNARAAVASLGAALIRGTRRASALRLAFLLPLLALAIGGLVWIRRRLPRLRARLHRRVRGPARELDRLSALYSRFLQLLAQRGVRRAAHQTPLEFAREATRRSGMPDEVAELTGIFCRVRYGGEPLQEEDVRRAERLLQALRRPPAA